MIVGHLGEGIAFVATSGPDACVHHQAPLCSPGSASFVMRTSCSAFVLPLPSLCFFCGGSLELFESPFRFRGQSFSSAFDYKVMKVWEITFLFNVMHFYYIFSRTNL